MGDSTLLTGRDLPHLLLITDHAHFTGEIFFAKAEAALKGGVDAVLAREKQMDSARLLAFCTRLRHLTRQYHARLWVHTQADIAIAVGADGVHVAQSDIGEIPLMRQWLNHTEMSISASCHDADALNTAAAAGADFAMLSPVFPTASHPGAPHLGAANFHELAEKSSLPVLALGGITAENRKEISGYSVATIRALLAADDPESAARQLRGLPTGEH
ncbi:MAG: thiamine phosphate synthase [Mariprofundaceae bacterium]